MLTFSVDGRGTLVGASVPYSDRLVPAGRGELLRVCGVPTQLVHTVTMALVSVVLALRHREVVLDWVRLG